LRYGDEGRSAPAVHKRLAYLGSDHARRHHDDVHVRGGRNQAKMNVVSMRKIQRLPAAQAGAQGVAVNLALDFIGDQQGQDVGALGDFGDRADHKAVFFRLARGFIAQASHHDVEPRVAQVQRLGAPLISIANDSQGFLTEYFQAGVGIVEGFHGFVDASRCWG